MQLLNRIRQRLLRIKLHLLLLEVSDVRDDMADALHAKNFGVHAALADFYVDLLTEINTTRRKIAALN